MKFVSLMVLFILCHASFAGATHAQFSCKSASGRTLLEASVPGDFDEFEVDLAIDNEKVSWYSLLNQTTYQMEENSHIYVLGSLKEGNYHFVIANQEGEEVLRFSAISSSIQLENSAYGERGSLQAKVYGQDPRADKEWTPVITLNCDYSYEI